MLYYRVDYKYYEEVLIVERAARKIFYRRVSPGLQGRAAKADPEYRNQLNRLIKAEEALNHSLDASSHTLYQQYQHEEELLQLIINREYFIDGFRLGAQIIMAVLDENDGPFTEL